MSERAEAAYTAPSKKRFTFLYLVSLRESKKKGKVFDFPGASISYVQDLGSASMRYSLTMLFNGKDYASKADFAMECLREKGAGTLEHPAYGRSLVNPISAEETRNHTTDALTSRIAVDFIQTRESLTEGAIKGETGEAEISAFRKASEGYLNDTLAIDSSSQLDALSFTQSLYRKAQNPKRSIIPQATDIALAKGASKIDTSGLAGLVFSIIEEAGSSEANTEDRLKIYEAMASTEGKDNPNANLLRDYTRLSCAALAASEVLQDKDPKPQRAAAITQSDTIERLHKGALEGVTFSDSASFNALSALTTYAFEALQHRALNGLQERAITLELSSNLLEVAAKLYPDDSIEEGIEKLTQDNAIRPNEVINMAAGQRLTYYA